ncbi:hypothetical protein PIB30_104691, partial [Stylosanthes scabra]|nr:hypothetical protein [Stylosanthes scabra]
LDQPQPDYTPNSHLGNSKKHGLPHYKKHARYRGIYRRNLERTLPGEIGGDLPADFGQNLWPEKLTGRFYIPKQNPPLTLNNKGIAVFFSTPHFEPNSILSLSYHRRPHLFPFFFSLFYLSLTPRLFCSSAIPNTEPLRRRPPCLRQQPPSRHWPSLSLFSPLRHWSLPLAQLAPSKTITPSTSCRRHGSSSAG